MEEENDYSGLLPLLRFNLRDTSAECACGCATFSDQELLTLLGKHDGNVNAASYEGLLIKAQSDSVKLPDGLELPDGRDYWLALARLYRPDTARNISRADEVNRYAPEEQH